MELLSNNIRLAIVGSRNFSNYNLAVSEINKILEENRYIVSEIVSGGARGADTIAEKIAAKNDIKLTVFPALWDLYGKSAGYKRNVQIIQSSDVVIAFWDYSSKGTKHSIDLSNQFNKDLYIIDIR